METHRKAWHFGHYDSRGGAWLVLGSLRDALARVQSVYDESFGDGKDDAGVDTEHYAEQALQSITSYRVVFADGTPDDENELLESYGGLYKAALVNTAYYGPPVVVFWRTERPTLEAVFEAVHTPWERGSLPRWSWEHEDNGPEAWGEDAWGVTLLR